VGIKPVAEEGIREFIPATGRSELHSQMISAQVNDPTKI